MKASRAYFMRSSSMGATITGVLLRRWRGREAQNETRGRRHLAQYRPQHL